MTPSSPALNRFLAGLPFQPDQFQLEAIEHIEAGSSVVVTAPTGAGKTLVAEVSVDCELYVTFVIDNSVCFISKVKIYSSIITTFQTNGTKIK